MASRDMCASQLRRVWRDLNLRDRSRVGRLATVGELDWLSGLTLLNEDSARRASAKESKGKGTGELHIDNVLSCSRWGEI